MNRSHFLVLAAVIPWAFGAVMMFVPDMMLSNSLAVPFDTTTRAVTQWVGFGVFSLGWITFLARHDPGSPALGAIMLGSILFHALGIGFDAYHLSIGVMTASGFVSGLIPHAALAGGFLYYLTRMRRETGILAGSEAAAS